MKYLLMILITLIAASDASASGTTVSYKIDEKPYEGYFISPSAKAPLILLIHDRDGLTGYEVKRANMLADLGYAVFAADLFGAGVRPQSQRKSASTQANYIETEKKCAP